VIFAVVAQVAIESAAVFAAAHKSRSETLL